MLQFGGFPIANATVSEETGSPIQPSADLRHTCAYPQLIAACHDLLRYSSRAIPQMGCSNRMCMYHTCASNPSVSSHANLDIIERTSPRRAPLLVNLPQTHGMPRCISNHPTYPLYIKASGLKG